MNLGDFRTRVSGEIGMSNRDGSAEQAQMDAWINDAVTQFLVETKCYVKPFSAALTAGDDSYDLGSSILSLKELYIVASDGTISPMLEPMSTDEIIWRKRFPTAGWAPMGYSLEGANLLLFSSPARDGDTLEGLYVPRATPMTDAAHDPSATTYGGIPTEFHETLVQYPLWKASIWDDDFGSAMAGTRRFVMIGAAYQDAWTQGLADAKKAFRKKAGVRWAPAQPGGRKRRRFVPTSPGIDTGR